MCDVVLIVLTRSIFCSVHVFFSCDFFLLLFLSSSIIIINHHHHHLHQHHRHNYHHHHHHQSFIINHRVCVCVCVFARVCVCVRARMRVYCFLSCLPHVRHSSQQKRNKQTDALSAANRRQSLHDGPLSFTQCDRTQSKTVLSTQPRLPAPTAVIHFGARYCGLGAATAVIEHCHRDYQHHSS